MENTVYGFEVWHGTTAVYLIANSDFLKVANEMLEAEANQRDGWNRYIGHIETWPSWHEFCIDKREREGMY